MKQWKAGTTGWGSAFRRQWWWVAYWRWLWMSRAERTRATAMRKLLLNVLANAPMDKIAAGESCSWTMSPGQACDSMEAAQSYAEAVRAKRTTDA